jgi:predicted permease
MDPRLPVRQGGSTDGGERDTLFSYPMFRDLEREQQPFLGLAAHAFDEASLSAGESTRPATVAFVSGGYFSVLGLTPALGRLLGPEDDRVDGQAESVVLSHAYWQSEFGGDPSVLGQTLIVNKIPLTIVGVAPRGFHGTAVSARPSVFVPITISSGVTGIAAAIATPNHEYRDHYWVRLVARLKSGVSREAAAASMNTLYRAILTEVEAPMLISVDEQQREAFRTRPLVLEPGARGQTASRILDPARNSLKLLAAVSGVVLLLCCANVAGLILLRAATRSGEIAVRASLGATRARLASLQLAESLVLALPAAMLSVPVAWIALRGASQVPGIPAAAPDVGLSGTAALVAIGIAIVAALAVGLLPVRGMLRIKPGNALQAYGARHTTTKGVARFRAALATVQVALSMALLATMAVFAQSLANIARLDLGADIESVVMFEIGRRDGRNSFTDESFVPRLEGALAAIPGVSSVASSMAPLLTLQRPVINVTLEGADAEALSASTNTVGPYFFRTFGTELLAGRDFTDTDTSSSSVLGYIGRGVIVNHRFAERFGLAPEAMIGRRITAGMFDPNTRAPIPFEIVGVIGDLRLSGKIADEIQPQMFYTMAVRDTFYVRSARPPEELMNTIRATVASVDPTMPVFNLQTMEQQLRANIAVERFVAGTATAFAVLATALAALGLYGVLAFSVAQRSREIGLRVALGAPTGRIRGMVLRQVAGMAAVGIVLGATAAWLLGRAAQSLLFGVEAGDPFMLAAAAVVLTAVTLGAAWIPARRASHVDPMTVLRYE